MVDDEVGDEVVLCDSSEALAHAEESEGTDSDGESDVARDNLPEVALVEDGGVGVEVVGEAAVVLSGGVADQVGGPAEELLDDNVDEVVQRRVLEELVELLE